MSDLKMSACFGTPCIYNGEIKLPTNIIKMFMLLGKRFSIKGLFKEDKLNPTILPTEEIYSYLWLYNEMQNT